MSACSQLLIFKIAAFPSTLSRIQKLLRLNLQPTEDPSAKMMSGISTSSHTQSITLDYSSEVPTRIPLLDMLSATLMIRGLSFLSKSIGQSSSCL